MKTKEAYENVLRELRKHKSPSVHLDDFNYWFNKGIQEYFNRRYQQFLISQQLTDDLQSLIVSCDFTITEPTTGTLIGEYTGSFLESNVKIQQLKRYNSDLLKFTAPDNYWHMDAAHLTAATKKPYKCYGAGYEFNEVVKKLTNDKLNANSSNAYLKPSIKNPYYSIGDNSVDSVVKPSLMFYYGKSADFKINKIAIDYLKEPQKTKLTIQQRDLPGDKSEELEFTDYVCNEIVKTTVLLILELTSDPRIQTKPQIDTTIP
jgi:hypothetical protein